MANTDPNEIEEGLRSGRRWTFQGFLNGVKASFGIGGQHIITAGSNGPSQVPGAGASGQRELMIAKSSFNDKVYTRMAYSEAKLKMWRNDFAESLEHKLRENFHPENYKRMRMMKHLSTNLLQRVVTDLSITYENPPRRFFKEDEQNDDQEDKAENTPLPPPSKLPPIIQPAAKEGDPPTITPAPPPEPPMPDVLNTGLPDVDALADLFSLEGAEKPVEDDILQKLVENSDIDAVMEAVEMYARFLPCVWVRPMVRYDGTVMVKNALTGFDEPQEDPATACLEFLIYTPDTADIVPDPDNPNRACAFWYFSYELNEKNEMKKFVNFWTPTVFIKLDDEWRIKLVEDNPYGEIPVAEVKLGIGTQANYYNDGVGDDIYEGALELAVLKTIQNARARDAGFKQLVISGADEKDIPADQVMGSPAPIYTSDGGTATVLDFQPELQQWTEMCEKRGAEISAKYGISAAEYKAEGTPQSGFAKKLDRDKILSANRRTRKFFKKAEIELYKKTRAVLEVRPVPAIGTLPDKTFDIDFAEPSFTEDPKDQAITDAQQLKLNLKSLLDIMKRENPDLTELELVEKAAKNKRINEAFIPKTASTLLDLLAATGKGVNPQAATELGAPSGGPAPAGGGKAPFGGK